MIQQIVAAAPTNVNDPQQLRHAKIARRREAVRRQCNNGRCPCKRWFDPRVRTQRYFNRTCKNRAAQQRYRAHLRYWVEIEERYLAVLKSAIEH